MLSVASVLTSLLLASVGTTATAVQARAGRCNPAVAGKQINIVNGQYQLGFPPARTSPTFANAPSSQVLYPTINANLTQVLLQPRITTFPGNTTQGWFFTCHSCEDPEIAYGCTVQSTGTGQCAVIGNTAGQTTAVQSCSGLNYGSQVFDVLISPYQNSRSFGEDLSTVVGIFRCFPIFAQLIEMWANRSRESGTAQNRHFLIHASYKPQTGKFTGGQHWTPLATGGY
ncbi:hypothetical protein C8J57DRAFT_1234775 [Mycena rebaudengoi]|nr:hypothetical protein C8J57DRAFT_1234775 [Mycena rebaudengoi]